jgi:hypothetical protein
MNMNSKKMMGVIALVALFAIALSVGMGVAHAQGACYPAQLHPAGDIVVRWGRFGAYEIVVPCVHWYTACN